MFVVEITELDHLAESKNNYLPVFRTEGGATGMPLDESILEPISDTLEYAWELLLPKTVFINTVWRDEPPGSIWIRDDGTNGWIEVCSVSDIGRQWPNTIEG